MGRIFRFREANQEDQDAVTHSSPWPEWFASQHDNRSVWICDKASDQKIKVEPPAPGAMRGHGTSANKELES